MLNFRKITEGWKWSLISSMNMQFLLCFALGNYFIMNVFGLPVSNMVKNEISTDWKENVTLTSKSRVVSNINCTFMTESDDLPAQIDSQMEGNTKVLVFKIHFSGWSGHILGLEQGNIYKPTYWVRARGRLGKGLLLLRHNYEILSLSTLSLNTHKMDISLNQSSPNCIEIMNMSTFEIAVRELLLNNFKKNEASDNICNIHIADDNGVTEFVYKCCHRNSDGTIHCEYLTEDFWLNMLFTIIFLLKLYVILASPRFIPDSWYRVKHVASTYTHRLGSKPLNLKVLVTKTPELYPNAMVTTDLSRFKYMIRFKQTLQTLKPNFAYNLNISEIKMKIKEQRMISEDNVPVGLLKSFYDSFVRCKIRERPAVSKCCYADICPLQQRSRRIPWHKCLSKLMMLMMMLILPMPWIVRVYLYYQYEHEEMSTQKDAASRRGLSFPFQGSVTLYLTPSHILFIVIYVMLSVEYILYGIVKKNIKQNILIVVRKCFRDMRERSITDVFHWSISTLLKPCTSFGVVGIFLGIIIWIFALPYVLLILSFYLFPTINLTLRMFAHFIAYLLPRRTKLKNNPLCRRIYKCMKNIRPRDKMGIRDSSTAVTLEKNKQESMTTQGRFFQLLVIIVCLVSLYFVIFLLVEIISFFVEMAVYTSVGIILNADTSLTYLSFIFILVGYANSCFSHVVDRYLSFNKALTSFLLELSKENLEEATYLPGDQQRNLAFRVKTDDTRALENPISLVKTEQGQLRWTVSRLVLFLGKNDMPFVPRKFFFEACKMPHYSCPGELLLNYLRACGEFSMIVVFLLFVLVIVLAFSETYHLSATNQLLAALAGGFLPWIFMNIVFRTHVSSPLDTSNKNFKICFSELLNKYEQHWPIDDIIVGDNINVHINVSEVTNLTKITSSTDNENNVRHSALTKNTDAITPALPNQIDLVINMYNKKSTSILDDTEDEMKETAL
ncbi:hypothetical protein CHS0354_017701 [Potamilus streckersoni]|uniref:Uncharacterized protein n=1 Tax=Potamilus streckersoni TaxID=2493646 RepID=A0AAE0S3I0_9BIVA|nr:hypothetical protein CHS0354_017701 [Potamilus streckersoni]